MFEQAHKGKCKGPPDYYWRRKKWVNDKKIKNYMSNMSKIRQNFVNRVYGVMDRLRGGFSSVSRLG